MKIRYSPYTLEGKPPFKNRSGALLRVEANVGGFGYCDVHPWPELGDKPLSEQLSLLKKGIKTPLTERSLHFASIDAIARASNKNLFTDLVVPQSHWLFTSNKTPIPENFSIVKIKADPSVNLKKTIESLPEHLKLRIDFNNKHTFESFSKFIQTIPEYWERIDFIEDPFPYNAEQWKSMPVPLAGDFQKEKGSIAIVKPAVEDIDAFLKCDRVIVTTYLDHPLGQLAAAYTAAKFKKSEICGLLSHLVYEKNAFSDCLNHMGPNFIVPTEGAGFGFDDLLEEESWVDL